MKRYSFFKFDDELVEKIYWQKKLVALRAKNPYYMLTRMNFKWYIRIPVWRKNDDVCYIGHSALSQMELFIMSGRRRKTLTWSDNMLLLRDLRAVWGDFPLHARIGHRPGGEYITEDITDEDELIIHLKYNHLRTM